MSLDIFENSIRASDQEVSANIARDLPANFSEAWDISTRAMLEWNSGIAFNVARANALQQYSDDIRQKTGEQLPHLGSNSQGNELNDYVSLDDFNAAQARLKDKYPGLDYLTPLSDTDIDNMAYRRMAKAHDDAAAISHRETTWGGTAGTVLGTLGGGLADPVTLATMPLGGIGEAGIALRALEFAAISGGSEAVNAGLGYRSREAAVPGSSSEIPGEVLGAAAGGALLGGAFGALSKMLGHGAKPLPTSVRDDVNAAASEFQFNATNPFPTAAGEAASRDATVEATRSLAKGETVNVGDDFAARHVDDYASAARAATPEELALAGEQHLRPETFAEKPDVEAFDRMPGETEDAASYWDRRVAEASAEERAALGATDIKGPIALDPGEHIDTAAIKIGDKIYRGYNHTDALDRAAKDMKISPEEFLAQLEGNDNVGLDGFVTTDGRFLTRQQAYAIQDAIEARSAATVAGDLTQEQVRTLAAEPATQDAVMHNLDHLMAANPEQEFTTQVRQPDGSYQFATRKLSDVMGELDGWEAAAKEIEACAVGGAMEAAE